MQKKPLPQQCLLSNEELIVDCLTQALPNLLAIYAFGSQINNTARPDSDLDLAVLVAGLVKPLNLWNLANDLANKLDMDVDLLDLRAASTVMQYQVVTTGKILYQQKTELDLFRCYVLSEKVDFDDARQKLLKRIDYEGIVYGR